MRPGLAEGVRLVHDPVRDVDALLYPEGSLLLDGPAPDVVRACDGRRGLPEIVALMASSYDGVEVADVADLIEDLVDRRLLIDGGPAAHARNIAGKRLSRAPLPVGMVAELTYRCPLSCGRCSNPVEASRREIGTAAWLARLTQARDLGVLQVHFSGGEPVLRPDLPELVAHARGLGMYTNLITSGIGLTARRLSGFDHVQLSVQHAAETAADAIAGLRSHHRKIAAAALVREAGLPLTVNVVLHAGNVDAVEEIAAFAAGLGASRLELAHTQYYGWGLRNRAAIMPTAAQIHHADEAAARVHGRYDMEIVYVRPDHHTGRPKPCMNGWASRQFAIDPSGTVLPCLAAAQLPGPSPEGSLAEIWFDSELFNRFRGTAWMPDPCRGCDLRELDFGGCRCQAFQLTGDAAATDPVCSLSPHHQDLVPAGGPRPAVIPRRYR
ncbi:pyrroloquinoline quinone biosynthesis protein PqqE [Paractinoplanes atraurantiacus]|uniref:PqqA peptide cyclase n=1 Tax=Paractinoplanes atraurantiacus TaxID=1036182 RepID=A0A285K8S6_9ACTN|nr:pyrroloquinoline quinone biosynthesis protein PqqE [Actinoplanes atraurantiacus]SNY68643.1 pyrroloquinoline quinone biosynthesis protein E [Actinoplanes atraurantiacus]